jgi:hypothetical protein
MEKAAERRHGGDRIRNALEGEPKMSFDFCVGFRLGQVTNVYRGFRHGVIQV